MADEGMTVDIRREATLERLREPVRCTACQVSIVWAKPERPDRGGLQWRCRCGRLFVLKDMK